VIWEQKLRPTGGGWAKRGPCCCSAPVWFRQCDSGWELKGDTRARDGGYSACTPNMCKVYHKLGTCCRRILS